MTATDDYKLGLILKTKKDENTDLALKLGSLIKELSTEFKKSIGDESIPVDNESTWTLHPECRRFYYQGREDSNDAFRFLCHVEIEKIDKNNAHDFLGAAVTNFLSSRNCAVKSLTKGDHATAMEHAFQMAKMQGCIAAAKNLAIAKKYFDDLSQQRIKAATSKYPDHKKLGDIFLEIGNKSLDTWTTMTDLLGAISEEFHRRWSIEFPEFRPRWNSENLPRCINNLRKNPDFDSAYKKVESRLREKNKVNRDAKQAQKKERKKAAKL